LRIRLTLMLALAFAGCAAPKPAARPALIPSNAELIDRLVLIGNDEFAVRSNIIGMGDDGQGAMPKGLLKMQDPEMKPADAMAELARRGVDAMPDLLAHVDDARQTKAVVEGMMGIAYSARYDWNIRTTGRRRGVTDDWFGWENKDPKAPDYDPSIVVHEPKDANPYHVAVGDLCYNLIGQIVNRDFRSIAYIPSGNTCVASPVQSPSLAAAVRKEWGGLTAATLKQRLLADFAHPDTPQRERSSASVLAKYYPDDLPAAITIRLNLPHYDARKAEDEVHDLTMYRDDTDEWKQDLHAYYNAASPIDREGLLDTLRDYRGANERHIAPEKLLLELMPTLNSGGPLPWTAVNLRNTELFVDSLEPLQSPAVERALYDCFRKNSTSHAERWDGHDGLAQTVMIGLKHRSHDADILAYLRRRLTELKNQDDVHDAKEMIADFEKK